MRTPQMHPRMLLPRGLLPGGLAVSLIALASCGMGDSLDPYKKPYAWHPTGAATANIAAQLVDPHDLVAGRGSAGTDAKEPVLAIQHVWTDMPKSTTPGGGGGSGGGSGSGNGTGSGPGASAGGQGGSTGGTGGSN